MSAATANPVPPFDPLQARLARIRVLLKQAEDTHFHLGKEFDELFAEHGNHGNGTYEKCLRELGVSKASAWRWRTLYRKLSGLKSLIEEDSFHGETNSTPGATDTQIGPTDSTKRDNAEPGIRDGESTSPAKSDASDEEAKIKARLQEEAKRKLRNRRISVTDDEMKEIDGHVNVLAPKYQSFDKEGRPDRVFTILEALRVEAAFANQPKQ